MIYPTINITPDVVNPVIKINNIDGSKLVYVPAGEFEMGGSTFTEEKPIHRVSLDAFWIYQTEVTNASYLAFLNDVGNQSEGGTNWMNPAGSGIKFVYPVDGVWQVDEEYEDHPVVVVSWYGARAYCEWAGGRLPTEAEWEKAARGTDGRYYPWGNGVDCNYANVGFCVLRTVPVGSYPIGMSPYGALDMCGNVWEWTADWYDEFYYYNSPIDNPTGPEEGEYRVLRGGSWLYSSGAYLRSVTRYSASPQGSTPTIGFRCVIDDDLP
jgi:formylglycine-generating enzyme required for sulfatase activity